MIVAEALPPAFTFNEAGVALTEKLGDVMV